MKSKHDVYYRKRIIAVTYGKVMNQYDYGYLEEIDKKISNLERDVIFDLNVALRMFTKSIVIQKQFCDGTLTSVITTLHDIASNLRIEYFPKRRWSEGDRSRSCIMIKKIDKQLYERRLMRNLEKFVGGKEYREDFRLLERII
ncbi:hypothetical protein Tco_0598491 [Tanacetum coccineum]